MRIAINAVSATAGGGRTYLLNLARVLPEMEPHQYLLYVPEDAARDLESLPAAFQVRTVGGAQRSYAARLLWEQGVLPREAKRWGAEVLLCVGNFCPLRSPVPVVLMSRNPLYFTPQFLGDLLRRGRWAQAVEHMAMTRLALWSARSARIAVTPTAAMADMIRATAGNNGLPLRTIHHGFQPWPGWLDRLLPQPPPPPPFRLLVVSHYNYFRNFETVFQALSLLRRQCGPEAVHLTLTTHLAPGLRPGGYDTTAAWQMMARLGLQDSITMLGAVPYDELPKAYGSAHAVICPAYTESFSHTVVEAMFMEVPVVASGIGVHREVAGDAALFFSPLDPAELADRCRQLINDAALRQRLRAAGVARARQFSWRRHFQDLLGVLAEAAR